MGLSTMASTVIRGLCETDPDNISDVRIRDLAQMYGRRDWIFVSSKLLSLLYIGEAPLDKNAKYDLMMLKVVEMTPFLREIVEFTNDTVVVNFSEALKRSDVKQEIDFNRPETPIS